MKTNQFEPVYNQDIARTYDLDRRSEEHWTIENIYIEKYFANVKFNSILDIPIGTGRFLKYYPKTASILGVDISQPMLDEAKIAGEQLGLPNFQLMRSNAEQLPIPQNSYEITICCRLFHLLEKKSRLNVLSELTRVTSKTIILQAYISSDYKSPFELYSRIFQKIANFFTRPYKLLFRKNTPWSHITSHPMTISEIESLAKQCGLTISEARKVCMYQHQAVYFISLEIPNVNSTHIN